MVISFWLRENNHSSLEKGFIYKSQILVFYMSVNK